MRRIVVTPAGRKRYLEILVKYLAKAKSENQFDRWDLWVNTDVPENIEYMKYLTRTYDWIKMVSLRVMPWDSGFGYKMTNIFRFFKSAADPNSVYVRLDDDIVYLEPDFFRKMFTYRIENTDPFLVFGNIINNAVISHLHQKNPLLNINYPAEVTYNCFDPVGTSDHKFCELIHNLFINDVKNNQIDKWRTSFDPVWIFNKGERVSVNCCSWFGRSMNDLGVMVYDENYITDEESWLTEHITRTYYRYNVSYNGAICAHYAFFTQREKLESETDILQKYRELSNLI